MEYQLEMFPCTRSACGYISHAVMRKQAGGARLGEPLQATAPPPPSVTSFSKGQKPATEMPGTLGLKSQWGKSVDAPLWRAQEEERQGWLWVEKQHFSKHREVCSVTFPAFEAICVTRASCHSQVLFRCCLTKLQIPRVSNAPLFWVCHHRKIKTLD